MARRVGIAVIAVVAMIAAACADDAGPTAPEPEAAAPPTTPGGGATTDPNLGYDELVAPTSPPRVLAGEGLAAGFVISPTEGCSAGALSQLARVDPATGTAHWVVELPWVNRAGVVADGAWVGWSSASRSSLLGVDIATGTPLWQAFTDGTNLLRVTGGADTVVVTSTPRGSESRLVAALAARTGEERWHREVHRQATATVLDDSVIVVDGAAVRALDLRSGAQRWVREIESEELSMSGSDDDEPGLDELIVVNGWPRTQYRLDPTDGSVLWETTAPDERVFRRVRGRVDDLLLFESGFSYESDGDAPEDGSTETVGALDLADGELVWSTQGELEYVTGPWIGLAERSDPVTFEVSPSVVVDARTGEVAGTYDEYRESPEPAVQVRNGDGGYLVEQVWDSDAGREVEQRLVAEPRGAPIWVAPAEVDYVHAIAMIDGTLHVGTSVSTNSSAVLADPGGWLFALDPEDGSARWRLELRDPFPHAPVALDDGALLVHAADPSIFCD